MKRGDVGRWLSQGVLLGALSLGGLLGGGPAMAQPAPLEGVLMASGLDGVRIYDPARGVIVFDYFPNAATARQAGCNRGVCFPLAANYVNHDDVDYLDVAIVRYGLNADDPKLFWPSVVTRVTIDTTPEEVWTVRELDFRDVPDGDSYCEQRHDEAFAPLDRPGCIISFAHGFDVIDDQPDEQRVTALITDPWNERILQVTLDYAGGNTAAHVDWVLGETHPEWPAKAWPNHVMQAYGDDGERYMLTTFVAAGGTPYSAAPLIMWRYDVISEGWEQMWRHPDPISGDMPYLQASHMGEILRDPRTGEQVIWYGHGRGLASDWSNNSASDLGGSFGLLLPGETLGDPPSYAFDVELFSDNPEVQVNYGRDVDYLEDGTYLMLDGACQTAGCPEEAGVYRVDRFYNEAEGSEKSGAFSGDNSTQTIRNVPESQVIESFHCDFPWLFEAEWIPTSKMGRGLKALDRRAFKPCYPEVPSKRTPSRAP